MYETFDHTADLGLRVRAANLDTVFAEAGEALFSAIVDDLSAVESREAVKIEIAGSDLPYLLFDWLKELLFRFDVDRMLFRRFDVRVGEWGLHATAWGEPLDEDHHPLSHEVKAITYHGLTVERTEAGWLAEVIVDI